MKKLIILLVMLLPVIVWSQGQPKASNLGTKSANLLPESPLNRSIPPGTLVWSQLPDCVTGNAFASQYDAVNGWDLLIADDFLFTTAPGEISALRWWIEWFNPGQYSAPSSFNIFIYNDASCLPGALQASYNIPFANANEDAHCNPGGYPSREYWAILSPSFVPVTNQHYWIAIQPVLTGFPQSGLIQSTSSNLCSAVQQFFAPYTPILLDVAFELYSQPIVTPVPITNWALFIGIGLILVYTLVRFRKIV